MRGWWVAGVLGTGACWALSLVVQVVSGDFLPPEISVSQYGVGPHGWLFSLWMLAVPAGPCCFYLYRPARGFGAGWWLLVGTLGAAVMAVVRTDAGGLQHSVHARVHTGGAVLAMACLPIGMMLALMAADRVWRRLAVGMTTVSAAALILLLVAAVGVDTSGMGPPASWAFWQAIALIVDMLLLLVQLFGARTVPPTAWQPEPWWVRDRMWDSAFSSRPGSGGRALAVQAGDAGLRW